jgi:hypothetical protein
VRQKRPHRLWISRHVEKRLGLLRTPGGCKENK